MKTVEYYNSRITALKATIRRLTAEKRIAILRERERSLRKQIQQGKWYRNRTIQAALIKAVAIILVPFISWFIDSHGNKQCVPYQKNDSLSIEIVTYGPNSPVNIYQTPAQSDVNSENK